MSPKRVFMDNWQYWLEQLRLLPVPLFYLVVFIALMMEYIFPPFPGDAVAVVAGLMIGVGILNPYLTAMISIIGSLTGISAVYFFGFKKGRKFFVRQRFLTEAKLQSIEKLYMVT